MSPSFLVLTGAIILGFVETVNGHLLKKFKDVSSVGLLIVGFIMTVFYSSLWIILFNIPIVALEAKTVVLTFIVGLAYYIGNKLFYTSFKHQEVSTSTIIIMSTIIITTAFGKLVFDEQVSLVQWLGVFLVAGSVFLINIGGFAKENLQKVFSPTKATKYVLVAAFLYGIGSGFAKFIVQDLDPHYYQFLEAFMVIPSCLLIDFKEVRVQVKVLKQTKAYLYLAPVIIGYFFYNMMRYVAFSKGFELPLADATDNIVVFVIIALEFLIFKIRPEDLIFKIGVAVLAVIGVVLITFGRSIGF